MKIEFIENIKTILNGIHGLKYSVEDNLIVVYADLPNGYDVTFEEAENCYIVSFGQWNEHLPKDKNGYKNAIELFKLGLSDSCRLQLFSKGDSYYKCILQYKDNESDKWVSGEKVSRVIFPFWNSEKAQIQTFQNNFIENQSISEVYKEIRHDRKRNHYKLNYFFLWLILFLFLNRVDLTNIQVSILLFFPLIVITLIVPLLAIGNWFDDRKYGGRKRAYFSKNEKRFLFIWLSLWALGFLFAIKLLGGASVFVLTILLFPIMIVGFFLPVYLYMEWRSKGKSG